MANIMHSLAIPHFEDMLLASGRSREEMEQELRLLLAIKLFELKRVSLGRAAEMAGLGRPAFMDELARLKLPVINFAEDQLAEEFRDV